MRVGVIGAGAVGGVVAALLDRAGHQVEVTARGEHLDAIRSHGLRLSGAWGDHVARVAAGDRLGSAVELAIVATKAQDAEAALCANSSGLVGIPVVVIQNGLEGVASARGVVARSDVVGGLALFAASYLSPGSVSVTTAGPLYLGGGGDDPHDVPVRYAAEVLGAVLPVEIVADFAGAQWTKLVVNQINALPAITGRSAQEVIAHRGLRRVMTASMREAVRVGRARGIRFAPVQGLTDGLLRAFLAAPPAVAQALPQLMRRRMGATPNPGSTLQSIRRGRVSEIDHLNGAVVSAAEGTSVPTPVNAHLVRLVHEVERTGRFFDPDEVVRQVAG